MTMRGRIVNAKIFNSIVEPISVFMMNNLVFLKRASKMFAHNEPMFKDVTFSKFDIQITARMKIFSAFPFVVFWARAKFLRKPMFISVFIDSLASYSKLLRDFFPGLIFFVEKFFKKFWIEFPHINEKDRSLTMNSQTICTII